MRIAVTLSVAAALAMFAGVARAELKSGPQVGEELGAFEVVKVAGAPNDGVEEGKELCYRCKLGNRPVVMVFANKSGRGLAALVKELDRVVAQHQDAKMASFVNLLGSDLETLKADAKELAQGVENVAFVVPSDQEDGPADYKINPEAEVTVLIYKGGTVAANHALSADQLNNAEIKKIIKDTDKILQ